MKSLMPFLIIAISVGGFYLYVSPTYGEINALRAKKAEYTDALSKAKELRDKRDTILAEYNAIAPTDIVRLKRIVPNVTDNVDVVTNINTIASQYGMTVRGVKITQPPAQDRTVVADASKGDPYKTITVAFSITGPYDVFTRFLTDLESNARLFDVSMLSIKTRDDKVGQGMFDYSVEVSAYSLR